MTAQPSIALQSVDDIGGPTSVLARQRRDHQQLNEMLDELHAAGADRQAVLLRAIWRLAFSHAFAEEAVLWPVLRRTVESGDDLTLDVEEEHQAICTLAVDLENMGPADERWTGCLAGLAELLRADARDEEDVLLPRLQEELDDAALRRLGMAWATVRRVAPTRPHPVVSRRPPGNMLAALPLGPLDRARDGLDALAGLLEQRWAPGAAAAAAASEALARVAGFVERVPAVRRGQRATTEVG